MIIEDQTEHPEQYVPDSPFQRRPFWRYREALGFLSDGEPGGLERYPVLRRTYRFLKYGREHPDRQDLLRRRFPYMYCARRLYEEAAPYSLRWAVEALRTGGASCSETAEHLCLSSIYPEEVMQAYSAMFYDIDQYEGNRLLLRTNAVMASCRAGGLRVYDFGWKLFAFAHGADTFAEQVLREGNPLGRNTVNWMIGVIRDIVMQKTLETAAGLRGEISQDEAAVLKMGLAYSEVAGHQLSSEQQNQMKQKFLEELSDAVKVSLMDAGVHGAVEVGQLPEGQYLDELSGFLGKEAEPEKNPQLDRVGSG